MKKLLILIIITFLAIQIFSQERTAYGVVNNIRTKEPIRNALVQISKTNRQVYTDSLGNFEIDVPKGSHHLLVYHPNYFTDDWWLKAPYWKKPMTLGLRDSIWEINDEARNKEQILTSVYEFNNCYRKKGDITHIDKKYSVLFILTRNGDTIEFNKSNPGRIIDTGVFGVPQIRLDFGTIDSTVFNKKSMESIWKNGIKYQFVAQDPRGYLCYQPEAITIPLSEIYLIKVRKLDNKKIVGATIIVAGGIAGVTGIALVIYAFSHMFDDVSF